MRTQDNIVLRNAIKNDVNEIYALEQRCFEQDAFTIRQFFYLVGKANSEFVVVFLKNILVAYLIILKRKNSKKFRIYSIAIAPEARGLGIGKMLMEYAEEISHKEGIRKISLEVSEKNTVAINLYRSKNYKLIARKENYYADGSAAFVMIKEI